MKSGFERWVVAVQRNGVQLIEAIGAVIKVAMPADRRVALIVAAAFFMETLDASIVVTALPTMARSFGVSTLALSAGVSAYLMAIAVFVPASSWLAERFGARRVFATAIAVFTLASLACGLSPSFWFFVASRALQGAAAAFMSPVGRLVVLQQTPKDRIIEALGVIVWPALIGPVVGPPLGGLIATVADWRWIFFLNLPIGVVGIWLVLRYIPDAAPAPRRRFDLRGFVLVALALSMLVQGLTLLAERDATRGIAVVLIAGGLAIGLLAVRHANRHTAPLLGLDAARVQTFAVSTLTAGMLARTALATMPFLLPLMYQVGFARDALHAGAMVMVFMAGNLVMKAFTTRILRTFGFRSVLVANGLLGAASIAACGLLRPDTPLALQALALLVAGMTRSMQLTAINTLAFADLAPAMRGSATTIAAMVQHTTAALGVAVGAGAIAMWQWGTNSIGEPGLAAFHAALLACALLMAMSAVWMLRLPASAGAEVAGHGRSGRGRATNAGL